MVILSLMPANRHKKAMDVVSSLLDKACNYLSISVIITFLTLLMIFDTCKICFYSLAPWAYRRNKVANIFKQYHKFLKFR